MAEQDLEDMKTGREQAADAKTAFDSVSDLGESIVHEQNKAAADAAGVWDASFIDYAEAINNYGERPDVESLDRRRDREIARDPAEFNWIHESGTATGSLG